MQMPTPHAPGAPPLFFGGHGQLPCGHSPHPRGGQLHRRSPFPLFHAGIPAGIPRRSTRAHPNIHPCAADRPLTARLHTLQQLGVAPSTRRTYQAGVTRFEDFCQLYSLCAYLSTSVKHPTIKLYLSAIRLHHIEHGHTDPTQDTLLQYVVKGIKRSQSTTTRPRLPITIDILRALKAALHNSTTLTLTNKRMLWAAFCIAFYGFLRASELCSPSTTSFDPHTTLCRADITLTPTSAHLLIKASKTDPFRQSCTVTIGATHTSTCPIAGLQKYLALGKPSPTSPLFVFDDGSFLTRQRLTSHLRTLLQEAGHNPDAYASHSFRIGAATTAAAVGLPDWQIQALGRWSSDCHTRYIRTPRSMLAQVSKRLEGDPGPTAT